MSLALPTVTAEQARRLLMGAQGLLDDPDRPTTPKKVLELIQRLGFVQLDSINVVERAHHLTLFSRVHSYRREHLTQLLEEHSSLFEHWTHDASAIPTLWFQFWKQRFVRDRKRIPQNRWWGTRIGPNPDKVLDSVRNRIAKEGPLGSRDFETAGDSPDGANEAWWNWRPEKAALEYLWRSGEISVVRRINFQKVYDLTERALPEAHLRAHPSEDEQRDWACATALERLGVATPRELAQFWNDVDASAATRWSADQLAQGKLVEVQVGSDDGSKPRRALVPHDYQRRLSRLPEPTAEIRLLCPFDPVLRDRARAKRLFGFDYRFEAFVPLKKRIYGYYVLPLLEGDRLVGRVDPKLHRDRDTLAIQRIWWERGVEPTKARTQALHRAVERMAKWLGASKVEWKR
jgi:uncharacterized protein YcaQ